MADRETRTLSDSLQNQGRFKKLEEFHARVEATCSKFGRFTIAEFIEEFGFINVSKYGYNSLEEFLAKRGCERAKDGTFVYKENLVSNVKKLLKSFGPPEFLPHNKEFLELFHSHADSILDSLKRFSVETFVKEISVVGPFDPLEYGYSSIEKLLFFRGCRQVEFEFIYDKETALKRKAVIVAAHLVNFTELEFMDTFKMFFQHKIALKKHGFRCLKSLLESVRCIKSDEPEINVIKILSSDSEVEILDVEDYSKRGEGSKLSSRDSQEDKNYAFDDRVVEYVKEDSKGVREKRVLVSDPVDSSITDAGEPVAKKKHTCLRELPPNTTETHGQCNAGNEEESVERDATSIVETASSVEPLPIPMDVSRSNPPSSLYDHILSLRNLPGQWAREQLSVIAAQIEQSIHLKGVIRTTDVPGAPSDSKSSQPSEVASKSVIPPHQSVSLAISQLKVVFHSQFVDGLIEEAIDRGVSPSELGKKIMDDLFGKKQ